MGRNFSPIPPIPYPSPTSTFIPLLKFTIFIFYPIACSVYVVSSGPLWPSFHYYKSWSCPRNNCSSMIMMHNHKKQATTGLKKPRRQNRDLGNTQRWALLKGGVQLGGGGLGTWEDEISVNGEDGERLLSKSSPASYWNCWRKPGAYFNISQPSPKRPTFSFGGGSYHGVPWAGAL